MLPRDARSLSPSAQQALREQAIRLRQDGKSYAEIGAIVGVHSTTVCQWYKRYERQGEAGLRARPRGRQPGSRAADRGWRRSRPGASGA